MADRYCPSCGTEVDADARFCPTCGITLEADEQPVLPDAPPWPQPEPVPRRPDEPSSEGDAAPAAPKAPPAATQPAEAVAAAPERAAPRPPPPPATPPPPPAVPAGTSTEGEAGMELPFTWPTMLSGWLIGVGSAAGAIALIPRLGDVVSVLLFLALVGMAATVFLPDRMPKVPRLRLITLVVGTIGLGIALDRSAFAVRGLETLLLLAMLAVAGGALLIELDRDRPMPPPAGAGG